MSGFITVGLGAVLAVRRKADKSNVFAHSIDADQLLCDLGDLLDVVRGAGSNFVEEDVFGDAAAKGNTNHVDELFPSVKVELLRQVLGKSERAFSSWNDSNLQQRVRILEEPASNCVASFMVSDCAPFSRRHHDFLLNTADDSFCGLLKLLHGN